MCTFVPSGQRKAGTPAVARRSALVAMSSADLVAGIERVNQNEREDHTYYMVCSECVRVISIAC